MFDGFEHAYTVSCPKCSQYTLLDNTSKLLNKTGKPKNGFYFCNHCNTSFKSVDTPRTGSAILNVRFKCNSCETQDTKKPSKNDIEKFHYLDINIDKLAKKYCITIPSEEIPSEWDRQQEDCLHRKGFYKFSDLFTKRNLLTCGFMFTSLNKMKSSLNHDEHQYLAF